MFRVLRSPSDGRRLLIVFVPFLVSACYTGTDGPSVLSTTSGAMDTESASESGAMESGGLDETGDGTGDPLDACDLEPAPVGDGVPVREQVELLDLSLVCNYDALVEADTDLKLNPDEDFDVYVYRPAQADGGWPSGGPWPAVFFVPGNGHLTVNEVTETDRYEELLPFLAEAGYVVFAGQPPGAAEELSSSKRMSMLACMMLWAKDGTNGWSQADQGRIGQAAIIAGHSRGGAAVNLLVDVFGEFQAFMSGMDDFELCGAIPIAPRWSDEGSDPTLTARFQSDAAAPPYLVLQGAIDEDTVGQGISAFDAMVPEDDIDLDEAQAGLQGAEPRLHDKLLLWFYGVTHNQWGGVSIESMDGPTLAGETIANFSGAFYIERFLSHQLYGTPSAYDDLQLLTQPAPDPAAFPTALQDISLWLGVTPQYQDSGTGSCTCESPPCDCERPLVFATHTPGLDDPQSMRLVVDSARRVDDGGDSLGLTCGSGQPADFLGPSSQGRPVALVDLDADLVCHGPAESLGDMDQISWQRHQTRAFSVRWGGGESGGAIEWDLTDEGVPAVDVSEYSYLTLRVANLANTATNTAPSDEFFCETQDIDVFELEVELDAESANGGTNTASARLGPSVEQHTGAYLGLFDVCSMSQHMRTVRIPMREFCDQGEFSPASLQALRVTFPDDALAHDAMIDSIEFTHDPLDPPDARCGRQMASWRCEAAGTLEILEASCDTEPTPSCASGAQQTNPVPLPSVPSTGDDPGFVGWVVHTPSGWVADPSNPTAAEREVVRQLCTEACTLEWSDDPDIDTSACHELGAFEAIAWQSVDGPGPVRRIPDSAQHGAGIFDGEQLTCALEGDCCEVFDEQICAARATRPTPASAPVARAEEYRAALGGPGSQITFTTPNDAQSMPVAGTAGYAFCPEGDTGTTCPFYLGSLDVENTAPVTLADTCPDGTPLSVELSTLGLELVQPAFGIASAVSYEKAMPRGSLHVFAEFVVNGRRYGIRAVNGEEVVSMTATRLQGLEVDGATVRFDVPCGLGTLPVTASIDLDTAELLDHPPSLTIDTPDELTCPGTLLLDATVSDPELDLHSVRWYVDDVLLAPDLLSLPMTQPHTLRAVARDARGATTTATKTIACRP